MKLFQKIAIFLAFLGLSTTKTTISFPHISKAHALTALGIAGIATAGYVIASLKGNSVADLKHFGKEILENPSEMGAGFPSSKHLAHALIAQIPERKDGSPLNILEVGAGTGIVTKYLIKRKFARLDAVELQKPLCDILTKKFGKTPNVFIHCTGIENFNPGIKYDAVIMTVPFNALPFELVKTIWEHVTQNLLVEGGKLSYFYYPVLPTLKKLALNGEKKEDFQKIQNYLTNLHKEHGTGDKLTHFNLPVARTRYFEFRKKETSQIAATAQ